MVSLGEHIFQVPLGDRWPIYHRLQELRIFCNCLSGGFLQVKVNSFSEALLVHSTLMQFLATRSELIKWLEFCWGVSVEE